MSVAAKSHLDSSHQAGTSTAICDECQRSGSHSNWRPQKNVLGLQNHRRSLPALRHCWIYSIQWEYNIALNTTALHTTPCQQAPASCRQSIHFTTNNTSWHFIYKTASRSEYNNFNMVFTEEHKLGHVPKLIPHKL